MGDFIERMGSLFEGAFRDAGPEERHFGVAVAEVVDNLDAHTQGRVQLKLPWLPGYLPWARVAVLSAGQQRGTFFMPQIGDEVLVAFNQGDVREPFVIGSLWNGRDPPPAIDAQGQRVLRTPAGHEIFFDDKQQSIVITSASGQKLTLDPNGIEVSAGQGAAKLTLGTSGEVTLEGLSISVKASASAELKATSVQINGDAETALKAGGLCTVQGALVKINCN